MSSVSSDQFKELVRSRTDIVQLIGETLTLVPQRGGRSFVALCPFHDDHNPSMQVNPERQSYRCWVCNEGGDCFSYVMKHDNLNFFETLKLLADRAGLELPASAARGQEDSAKKTDLYGVLSWAEEEFHKFLLSSAAAEPARQYLSSRGLTLDTITRFKLGFYPEGRTWLQDRARGRFDAELLAGAKLIAPGNYGPGYYEYFQDRVMFPIRDERSRTVAFGGRILPGKGDSKGPKYTNGYESPLFSKHRICYGLDRARDAIRKQKTVVVVEGYMDCIKCHQAGVDEVVATLGTALTETHVSVLRRMAPKVVLLFDGDEAGQRAAERSLPRLFAQDVDLRILILPEGLDPDEYVDAHGSEALRKQIETAPEALEYKLQITIARHGTATVAARQNVLEEMLDLMSQSAGLAGTIRERLMISRMQQRLGLSEQELSKRLRELRGKALDARISRSARTGSAGGSPDESAEADLRTQMISLQRSHRGDDLLECELLQILLTSPDTIAWISQHVGPDDFYNPVLQQILACCFDLVELGGLPTCDALLARLESPSLKGVVVWIDERAQERGVPVLLSGGEPQQDAVQTSWQPPALLAEVIERFKLRRERQTHEAAKVRRGQHPAADSAPGAGLHSMDRDLLLRAMQFHQNRAAKPSPS